MGFEHEHDERIMEQGGAEPATKPPDFSRFAMGEIIPLKGFVFTIRGKDFTQGRQWLILEYVGVTGKEERRLKLVK